MSYEFKSDLAGHISKLIASLTSPNVAMNIGKYMKKLDDYCIETGHRTGFLDRELVEGFCSKATDDKEARNRVNCVRRLACYIVENGSFAYVQPYSTCITEPKEIEFKSCLSTWMYSFVKFKQSQGYSYCTEKRDIHSFDVFLVENGYEGDELTQKMVEKYSIRPASESPNTIENKLSVVRNLGKYILKNGGKAYILESSGKSAEPMSLPECFTPEQVASFLDAVDNSENKSPWSKYVYPVYFRILYLTGMRENEACKILRSDVDYDSCRILIRNAKGQKDRYVYLSDFGIELLKSYDAVMERYAPGRKYLFTSSNDLGRHLSRNTVITRFRAIVKKLGLPIGLTVHSFRHTYVIDKIAEFEKEGLDVNNMLAYLSAQLGHSSIAETYYYCKRLDTKFSEIFDLDSASDGIIPEVENEED